jgi:hypothetical protein
MPPLLKLAPVSIKGPEEVEGKSLTTKATTPRTGQGLAIRGRSNHTIATADAKYEDAQNYIQSQSAWQPFSKLMCQRLPN